MSAPVLLTYATRYGATREVANEIAAALRARGREVDLQPLRRGVSPAGFGAVVLGAPLYMFRLHRNARRFR